VNRRITAEGGLRCSRSAEVALHIQSGLTVQAALLQRVLSSLHTAPHEVADTFEDEANRLLDLADLLRTEYPIGRSASSDQIRF
jgi:hypothetical protein